MGDPRHSSSSGDRLRILGSWYGFHLIYEVLPADGLDQCRHAPDVPLLRIVLPHLSISWVDPRSYPIATALACDRTRSRLDAGRYLVGATGPYQLLRGDDSFGDFLHCEETQRALYALVVVLLSAIPSLFERGAPLWLLARLSFSCDCLALRCKIADHEDQSDQREDEANDSNWDCLGYQSS